jgi:nitrogen fixation/metabolism regulation signal transduction histidine kinase
LGAGLNPRVATALDDAVDVYGELVKTAKAQHRAFGEGVAHSRELAQAAAGGESAIRQFLTLQAEEPGVFVLKIHRLQGEPIEVVEPPAKHPGDWLTRTESFAIEGLAGLKTLEITYGMRAGLLDRFRRMEREVLQPFRALQTDRSTVADIYAWSFVGYLGAAVFLAALVSVVVARRVTRRLATLHAAMETVAEGDLSTRVQPSGRDEVADLARRFNEMTRRLAESQSRLQYLKQVSAWQDIARKLAHEIKNPLTPILLAAQQAHESYKGEDRRHARTLEMAREIVEQEVHVLKRLVSNFSSFARLPRVSAKPEDVVAFLNDVVNTSLHVGGLTLDAPTGPISVGIDRDLLRQALVNLIKNAAEACRDAQIEPQIQVRVRSEDETAVICIDDNGPGVPEADRERIFDPYVTGKHDGTGLGLAIV